jgi:putative alpha-1,2-mannosidase
MPGPTRRLPPSWGTWRASDVLQPGNRSLSDGPKSKSGGAWFTFAAHKPVLMKIGISFVSIEQARRNLEAEIPGFDFAATRMQRRSPSGIVRWPLWS